MDEKKTSSWDDLIQELGAQPTPDALERRPAIETEFEPPIAAHAPKAKRGDWNALADQLGVEAPPEEPPRARGDASRPSSASGSTGAMEASFAEIEPMESAFDEIMEEEISDVEFEVDEDFRMEDESGEPDDSSALSGEAARNAFEALFQAGSFSALPPLEKTPRKPEGRPGPQWRDIQERPRQARDEEAPDQFEGEQPRERSEEGPSVEEGDRLRTRRRRGRGRLRHQDEQRRPRERSDDAESWAEPSPELETEGETASVEPEFEEAEGEKRPRRRRRRGRGGRGERREGAETDAGARDDSFDGEEAEDSAHDQADDHDDELEADEDAPRGSHKNIPSWSEAIGVMVETNMQARKSSPQRPVPSRERGRGGRGRGRGGHGRRS